MGFFKSLNGVTLEVLTNEPMNGRTTFRAGGAARYFVSPRSFEEASAIARLCKESGVALFPLGNGSNVLFRDGGFNGVVMSMLNINGIAALTLEDGGDAVAAGAGVLLKDLTAFCADGGFAGLEFACGIPGSVGGAVYMNAGAYDSEMAARVIEVTLMDKDGEFLTKSRDEMCFGYRKSVAREKGLIVVSSRFALTKGDSEAIYAKIDELNARRADKQPVDIPSAGSTFKRPPGHFAGKLIMDSGLSGFAIGGAKVSKKHCGFVVNDGKATATEILAVIDHVIETVRDRFGVTLEPEVVIVGDDDNLR